MKIYTGACMSQTNNENIMTASKKIKTIRCFKSGMEKQSKTTECQNVNYPWTETTCGRRRTLHTTTADDDR